MNINSCAKWFRRKSKTRSVTFYKVTVTVFPTYSSISTYYGFNYALSSMMLLLWCHQKVESNFLPLEKWAWSSDSLLGRIIEVKVCVLWNEAYITESSSLTLMDHSLGKVTATSWTEMLKHLHGAWGILPGATEACPSWKQDLQLQTGSHLPTVPANTLKATS